MKKTYALLTVTMLIFGFAALSWAENATQEEAVQKCSTAAKMIKEKGIQHGVQEIGSKQGPFVWKDSYVFVMDMDGKMLAHPMVPELTKRDDLLKTKNSDGRMLFLEFIKLANEKESGWVDYMWPKPGSEKPVAKSTYVQRVPGTQYIVCAGVYK